MLKFRVSGIEEHSGWFGLKDQGSGNVMIMEINEKDCFLNIQIYV